jgi:UDP-N-acetylglucosamine 2-epimerase (non-hydrolysing)
MKLLHVVGARPNFMKAAPVINALGQYTYVSQLLVHTGQHYDANMSDIFFKELGLPTPDVNLEVGSGSHAMQTAEIMTRFEPILLAEKPDWIIVYGDVNSTIAAALVAVKHHIPTAHVEAGLRSFDRAMPEEINRLLTDQIADLLFTPSPDGNENLLREGIAPEKIHLVGNVMIDTLIRLLPAAAARWPELCVKFDLGRFALVTLHRPSNVDAADALTGIMDALVQISRDIPVIFPVHPRTRQRIEQMDQRLDSSRLQLVDPLGYLDFLTLQREATLVITDSGGIQEETTFLGTPCLTVRENTERPITVTMGSNILVGQDTARLQQEVKRILAGGGKPSQTPPLWDGQAGRRIARILLESSEPLA